MEQMEQKGLGNTSSKPSPKAPSKSRKFCFTLNNYTVKEYGTLEQHFLGTAKNYIMGKERGEGGTPHIQGFVEYKNPRSFNSLKKICKRLHIEKAKGSLKQNYEYCKKEGDFATNIDLRTAAEKRHQAIIDEEYNEVKWKPWQTKVLKILDQKPDKRKIHWFWEPTGNTGKSFLCKYLALTKDVIICEGKRDNIFNQVKVALDEEKEPGIIICDIPRTTMEYLNYGALEQLKNGMLYSGKYEGGQCIFKIPHVICFANEPPDKKSMSKDRWDIHRI